jgi:hypothetical protein
VEREGWWDMGTGGCWNVGTEGSLDVRTGGCLDVGTEGSSDVTIERLTAANTPRRQMRNPIPSNSIMPLRVPPMMAAVLGLLECDDAGEGEGVGGTYLRFPRHYSVAVSCILPRNTYVYTT